jgi:hypothetical protein
VSEKANQTRMDQVPTVTEKSSGLQYESAMLDPSQEKPVQNRDQTTKNDKS